MNALTSAVVTEQVPINTNFSLIVIRAEGATAVLGQCTSLAHLDLGENEIADEGAGRLVAVIGQCASLAHLNMFTYKYIRSDAGNCQAQRVQFSLCFASCV